MARRCNAADFSQLVAQARLEVPDFNATTDIIVGFPGETDGEWQQTLDFVERIGFGQLHIFTYSPRPGTRAADLPGQVDREIRKARSQELHTLGHRLKKANLEAYIRREFPVLIEGKALAGEDGCEVWGGYTPNFMRVSISIPAGLPLENIIRRVHLESVADSGEQLIATLL